MEQPKNRVNFRALATVIVEYRSRATSLTYACVTPISSATVTWVTPAREIAVATRLAGGEARRTASCRSVSIQETTIREERRRSCRTHELRPHPKTHECWPNGQRIVWMRNRARLTGRHHEPMRRSDRQDGTPSRYPGCTGRPSSPHVSPSPCSPARERRFRGDLAIPSRTHWDGILADGTLGPVPWDRPHGRAATRSTSPWDS